MSRPGADGAPTSFSKWLNSFDYLNSSWEERNAIRTQAIEQAGHDKHLFLHSGKNPHIELKMPEYVTAPFSFLPLLLLFPPLRYIYIYVQRSSSNCSVQ